MDGSSKQSGLYPRKILESVLDFLCAAGTNPDDVLEFVRERLERNKRRNQMPVTRRRGRSDDTVTAAILHRWHRDPALTDKNALPRPLKLTGKAPSVEALVSSEYPQNSPKAIIDEMLALKLLTKTGTRKYLPRARVATIAKMHPVLIEHVARSISRLLETVNDNTSRRGVVPLIERFTHIPDLPADRIAEFRDFSQKHGTTFLAGVDDWLESRRIRNTGKRKRGAAAGVHVFAYLEDASPSTRRAKRA